MGVAYSPLIYSWHMLSLVDALKTNTSLKYMSLQWSSIYTHTDYTLSNSLCMVPSVLSDLTYQPRALFLATRPEARTLKSDNARRNHT